MLLIGAGSNILLTEDFNGTVIKAATKGVKIHQDDRYYYLEAEAGEDWHAFVCYCLEQGIAGLEQVIGDFVRRGGSVVLTTHHDLQLPGQTLELGQ